MIDLQSYHKKRTCFGRFFFVIEINYFIKRHLPLQREVFIHWFIKAVKWDAGFIEMPSGRVGGRCAHFNALIFGDDGLHLILLLFHFLNQLKLGAATVEIVPLAMNLEINIAIEIIRQEPDATF